MAVKIRLARRGNKKRPFYHIVAAEDRAPRDGRFLELIGRYNPLGETTLEVDTEKAQKWLSVGALLTPRTKRLLERAGIDPKSRTITAPAATANASTTTEGDAA